MQRIIVMGRIAMCKGSTEAKSVPVSQPDGNYCDCDIFMSFKIANYQE